MKKILISTLMILSASLAHAETDPRHDECEPYLGLAVDQPARIASHDDSSIRPLAGDHPVDRVDCAMTPYLGVCEAEENAASAY
jgi:hypothetical protein